MHIIHYKHWVWEWPWLHLIQNPVQNWQIYSHWKHDWPLQGGWCHLVKWQEGLNTYAKSLGYCPFLKWECIRYAMNKEVMPPSTITSRGPGIVSVQWETIEVAFICKNQVFGLEVCTCGHLVFCTISLILFNCWSCHLGKLGCKFFDYLSGWIIPSSLWIYNNVMSWGLLVGMHQCDRYIVDILQFQTLKCQAAAWQDFLWTVAL